MLRAAVSKVHRAGCTPKRGEPHGRSRSRYHPQGVYDDSGSGLSITHPTGRPITPVPGPFSAHGEQMGDDQCAKQRESANIR